MDGILKEKTICNGMTFNPGTRVHFEGNIAGYLDNCAPSDSIVVRTEIGRYPIKIFVRKSIIEFDKAS